MLALGPSKWAAKGPHHLTERYGLPRLEAGTITIVAHLMRDFDIKGVVKRLPVGTAFFVGGDFREVGTVYYAITCRHLIEEFRNACGVDSPVATTYVRVNSSGGGFEDVPFDPNQWALHPDTDLAAVRFPKVAGLSMDGFRLDLMVGQESFVSPHVGDPVTFMSLFTQSPGRTQIEPVARFGHISRMPGEQVLVQIGADKDSRRYVDAYLVEAHSWGGHSGSPALVYKPAEIPSPKEGHGPWLLGVVQGHAKSFQKVKDPANERSEIGVDLNAGMAVVIPGDKIDELLAQPELDDERGRLAKEIESGRGGFEPD